MYKRKKIPVQLQTTITLTIEDAERICQALEYVLGDPQVTDFERSYFQEIYNEIYNADFRCVR